MARRSRRAARWDGSREANAIAANLGRELRATRKRRHLRQVDLGDRVGLSQAEISVLEGGHGARTSIETWVAIGVALARPVAIGFSRDVVAPLNDAAHLEAQELVLRIATASGWRGSFEARATVGDTALSTDLVLTRGRSTVFVEIWNRLDDLGAAVRSTDRKLRARPGAASLWLFVDTAANHAIVRRFPTVLRARFPASSTAWVRAITVGDEAPTEAGTAWIDLRAATVRPLRLRA